MRTPDSGVVKQMQRAVTRAKPAQSPVKRPPGPQSVSTEVNAAGSGTVWAEQTRGDERLKEAGTSILHRALFERAGIGIALTDERGWIRLANHTLCAMLGYADDELQRKSLDELSHSEDVALHQPTFQEICRTLSASEIGSHQTELRLICQDGHATWVRLTVTPLTNDPLAGQPPEPGMVCVVEDITHHRQVESALQQEANYLNLLIESSGHAIITISLSGDVQSWNATAETLFGWRREEIIGRPFATVCLDPAGRVDDLMAQVLRTARPVYNLESQCHRRDGEPVSIMTTLSPILDATGVVTGIVSMSTDVSEHKRLEHEQIARQRAEAILREREMLARELHDNLSQDLSYVQMQVATIRELLAQSRATEADVMLSRLADVTQATQSDVREQIRNLFARPVPQGLVPTLQKYLTEFEQFTDIRVALRAPEKVGEFDLASDVELQFMRIIQEAMNNVRKHANARSVDVVLEPEPQQFVATITDDGRGFVPVTLEDSTSEAKHFGLRIMQERAHEVGGSVVIESTPGQGSKVIVRMPYNRRYGVRQPETDRIGH